MQPTTIMINFQPFYLRLSSSDIQDVKSMIEEIKQDNRIERVLIRDYHTFRKYDVYESEVII